MFQFKQFSVDQSGCAMKINTDGVLLGAMASAERPGTILDIGTGTGVIALMLAQRFNTAKIDAVEIDEVAAKTAERNFKDSPFADRVSIYALCFEQYFEQFPESKYELIVSNPPFYIDSLKSPGIKKTLAKHTDVDFFKKMIRVVSEHLTNAGCFWIILPVNIAEIVVKLSADHLIYAKEVVHIRSYPNSDAHRVITCLSFSKILFKKANFTIYKTVGVYSEEYQKLLQPYFLAF